MAFFAIKTQRLPPVLVEDEDQKYADEQSSAMEALFLEKQELALERKRLIELMEENKLNKLYEPLKIKVKSQVEQFRRLSSYEDYCINKHGLYYNFLETCIQEHEVVYFLMRGDDVPKGMITSKGVYLVREPYYHNDSYTLSPVYQFTQSLTKRSLELIEQLFDSDLNPGYGSICSKLFPNRTGLCQCDREKARGTFEKVIKLIPGGYSNGSWTQLEGFFGAYYDPISNKLSMSPPPQ